MKAAENCTIHNNEVFVDLINADKGKSEENGQGNSEISEDDSGEVIIEREDNGLLYNVNEVPPPGIIFSIAMQVGSPHLTEMS